MRRSLLLALLALPVSSCSSAPAVESTAPSVAPREATAEPSATPKVAAVPPAPPAPKDPFGPPGVLDKSEADAIRAVGEPPVLTLLEPGEEPRAELRYRIAPGARRVATIRIELVEEIDVGDGFEAAPHSPSSFRFALRSAKTATSEAFDIVATLEGVFDRDGADEYPQLKGSTLHFSVSSTGRVSTVKLKPNPKASELMAAALAESREMMQALYAILPAEPAGVGAKWQILSRERSIFADYLVRSTYTLKSRSGDALQIDGVADRVVADPARFGVGRAVSCTYRTTADLAVDLTLPAATRASSSDTYASTSETKIGEGTVALKRRGKVTIDVAATK